MRLGREVEDDVRLDRSDDVAHRTSVGDVATPEAVARTGSDICKRGEVARVGQVVDHGDVVRGVFDEMPDERRADESGAARHQKSLRPAGHVRSAPRRRR